MLWIDVELSRKKQVHNVTLISQEGNVIIEERRKLPTPLDLIFIDSWVNVNI